MKGIKPSQLPNKFHGDVWVTKKYFHDSEACTAFSTRVQNYYRGTIPEMWNGECWEFISDDKCRVMILEKPDSTNAFVFIDDSNNKDKTVATIAALQQNGTILITDIKEVK